MFLRQLIAKFRPEKWRIIFLFLSGKNGDNLIVSFVTHINMIIDKGLRVGIQVCTVDKAEAI